MDIPAVDSVASRAELSASPRKEVKAAASNESLEIFTKTAEAGEQSEQRVDEWRNTGPREENQRAEKQQRRENRYQPPFLVMPDKAPELPQNTLLDMLAGSLLEFHV